MSLEPLALLEIKDVISYEMQVDILQKIGAVLLFEELVEAAMSRFITTSDNSSHELPTSS